MDDQSGIVQAPRPDQPVVYRHGLAYRAMLSLSLCGFLLWAYLGVELSGEVSSAGDHLAWAVVGIVVPALLLWWAFRMRVIVDRNGVRVLNFIVSHRIPWQEIDHFEARRCLCILTRDGRPRPLVEARGVTTSYVRGLLGRVDPLDQAAAALNSMLDPVDPGNQEQRPRTHGGGRSLEERRRLNNAVLVQRLIPFVI